MTAVASLRCHADCTHRWTRYLKLVEGFSQRLGHFSTGLSAADLKKSGISTVSCTVASEKPINLRSVWDMSQRIPNILDMSQRIPEHASVTLIGTTREQELNRPSGDTGETIQ